MTMLRQVDEVSAKKKSVRYVLPPLHQSALNLGALTGQTTYANFVSRIRQKQIKIPMKTAVLRYCERLKTKVSYLLPTILIFTLILAPFCLLFLFDADSFSRTWKGRTFYLFFLWLVFLEILLEWETVKERRLSIKSPRFLCFAVASTLPAFYAVAVHFLGLNSVLFEMVDWLGIPFIPDQTGEFRAQAYSSWVLSVEYLVFTVLFAMIFWLAYHKDGLKIFSVSLFFIGAIGTIYMIDTIYPYGYFTPLQAFVPLTASMAANILNWLGYQTVFIGQVLGVPILQVSDASGNFLVRYGIGWPCAGVQSLLIYTFVILIFFKKTTIPLLHKIAYFAFGALITYCINILRIVAIYLTYIYNLSQGKAAAQQAASLFHDYYGGLLSMTWIMIYPLLIIGTRILWNKIRTPPPHLKVYEKSTIEDYDSPTTVIGTNPKNTNTYRGKISHSQIPSNENTRTHKGEPDQIGGV